MKYFFININQNNSMYKFNLYIYIKLLLFLLLINTIIIYKNEFFVNKENNNNKLNDINKKSYNINSNKSQLYKDNLISVIIPIYNSENTIKSSVESIQSQNFSKIEIILINDNSKDNSYKIIKNIQKYDNRIIIINNKKNRGTLYSRCIGVLNFKEYNLNISLLFKNRNAKIKRKLYFFLR